MAIRRHLVITCDGPCGTTYESDKSIVAPKDWVKIAVVGHDANGSRETHRAYLCSACTARLFTLMSTKGFCLANVPGKPDPGKPDA
jgi:hypothetical protein